jgi:hypothetical protein
MAASTPAGASARRATYFGGLAPPLPSPPLDGAGGFTPPVPGSTPPPPWGPPPVPAEGACVVGAGAGAGAGETEPPDPELGVELPEPSPSLCLREGDSGVVTPPEIGVVVGWNVGGGVDFDPPPLDAMATTTMRKKMTPPKATSLRRRYTAWLSRAACTAVGR